MLPKDKWNWQLIPLWPNTEPLAITKITWTWDLTLNTSTNFIEIVNPNEACVCKYGTWVTSYTNSSFGVDIWVTHRKLKDSVTILSFCKIDWWNPTWLYVWEYNIG